MPPVDSIAIHFDPSAMRILNIAMAFLMFSVAIDIHPKDFRKVAAFPRSVMVGLLAQYILFPLLTLAMIFAFRPPVSVALGMVLVSCCPSGNITNFLVHYAKANIALSVTLNAIIILAATAITPGGFSFWGQFVPDSAALRQSFSLPFWDMATIITLLILIPLLAGMTLHMMYPNWVARARKKIQNIALLLFFAILILALANNFDNIKQYLRQVFLLVAVHNLLGLAIGYFAGKIARLPESDNRTLAFETGVHNTALGLILIFNFFNGLGGMALLAAWWGIWDLVTGFALARFWKNSYL